MEATTEKVPVLVRVARKIVSEWGALHVDNFTGRIVHDKKIERALVVMGLDQDDPEFEGAEPIVIKRKRGGPKINPVLLDATTASMIVQVWDKLSPENRARIPSLIERLTVIGFVGKLWKMVG